jgi:hypothetical protein
VIRIKVDVAVEVVKIFEVITVIYLNIVKTTQNHGGYNSKKKYSSLNKCNEI